MGTTTLQVPVEYAEAFRDAVLVELREDAKALIDNIEVEERHQLTDRARVEDARLRGQPTDPPRQPDLGDVLWPERCLRQDFALLKAAHQPTSDDLEVTGATDALAHAVETMARTILPPKIASEVGPSPLDGASAESVLSLTQAMVWAVKQSDRLHGIRSEQADAPEAVSS